MTAERVIHTLLSKMCLWHFDPILPQELLRHLSLSFSLWVILLASFEFIWGPTLRLSFLVLSLLSSSSSSSLSRTRKVSLFKTDNKVTKVPNERETTLNVSWSEWMNECQRNDGRKERVDANIITSLNEGMKGVRKRHLEKNKMSNLSVVVACFYFLLSFSFFFLSRHFLVEASSCRGFFLSSDDDHHCCCYALLLLSPILQKMRGHQGWR